MKKTDGRKYRTRNLELALEMRMHIDLHGKMLTSTQTLNNTPVIGRITDTDVEKTRQGTKVKLTLENGTWVTIWLRYGRIDQEHLKANGITITD